MLYRYTQIPNHSLSHNSSRRVNFPKEVKQGNLDIKEVDPPSLRPTPKSNLQEGGENNRESLEGTSYSLHQSVGRAAPEASSLSTSSVPDDEEKKTPEEDSTTEDKLKVLFKSFSPSNKKEDKEALNNFLSQQGITLNDSLPNDEQARTPLFVACEIGNSTAVDLLLEEGADVNKKAKGKWTPLHIACCKKHKEIVKKLLAYTPKDDQETLDLNSTDKKKWTPLHLACYSGYIDIVQLLINDSRISLNKLNNGGVTPLHLACYRGNQAIVALLLTQSNLAVTQTDEKGNTPLDIACKNKKEAVVDLLLKNTEVVTYLQEKQSKTPYEVAQQYNFKSIISRLKSRHLSSPYNSILNTIKRMVLYPLDKNWEKDKRENRWFSFPFCSI